MYSHELPQHLVSTHTIHYTSLSTNLIFEELPTLLAHKGIGGLLVDLHVALQVVRVLREVQSVIFFTSGVHIVHIVPPLVSNFFPLA